jgi:hypothetical protein
MITIVEAISNEDVLFEIEIEEENLYKIVLESPSYKETQIFIKSKVYKRLNSFKNVSILFIYTKDKGIEKYNFNKPLEFKKLLYENIKHNANMVQIYNKLL